MGQAENKTRKKSVKKTDDDVIKREENSCCLLFFGDGMLLPLCCRLERVGLAGILWSLLLAKMATRHSKQ